MPKKKRPSALWLESNDTQRRRMVAEQLLVCNGNVTHAARNIGVSRTTIQRYRGQLESMSENPEMHPAGYETGVRSEDSSVQAYDAKKRLPKMLQLCEGMVAELIRKGDTEQAQRWVQRFFTGCGLVMTADKEAAITINNIENQNITLVNSPEFGWFMDTVRAVLAEIEREYEIDEDLYRRIVLGLESDPALDIDCRVISDDNTEEEN